MNIILIKEYVTYEKVRYYTLQYEGHERNETDKFFDKMEKERRYTGAVNHLVDWIERIGNNKGAKATLFRDEDKGYALPPPGKGVRIRFLGGETVVRLYCIRLSNNIVILGNGAIKTKLKALDCPNCKPHFRFINSIARQIYGAELVLKDKEIQDIDSIYFQY